MKDEKRATALRDASAPMVTVLRGDRVDSEHVGFACLTDADGNLLWSLGDPKAQAFIRSSAKPFQAMAVLTSGAADAAGLDERDLAVICGSHNGGPEQKAQVAAVLAKSGLRAEDLRCSDPAHSDVLADQCSGKHAGMLTGCKHLHLPLESYLRSDHPWQHLLTRTLCEYCAIDAGKAALAVDGCSAPTLYMSLHSMALGFARLGRESAKPGPALRILRAMAENPALTGEPDLRPFRADGNLHATVSPKLPAAFVSKGGANGLLCAAVPGLSLGFAVKAVDGAKPPLWPVFTRALEKTGVVSAATAAAMREALWPKVSTRWGVEAGLIRTDF